FATANDPVQDGLVKSINRPGGNTTGTYVLNTVLVPKRLEVLRQLVPSARLVGFLVNPNNASAGDQLRQAQPADQCRLYTRLHRTGAQSTWRNSVFDTDTRSPML